MRRRDGDGCPVWGVLQMVGDKWTMLVVRELARGPRRTTELLAALQPISSRTLMDRLRDMEHDALIERHNFGGSPPHVEYALTARGCLLLPLLDALRAAGQSLGCNECADRQQQHEAYCAACPQHREHEITASAPRRQADDSIVLL